MLFRSLTAQDEYVIRENLLTDSSLPRQSSVPDAVDDVVPQNIKLYPLPPEVVQKVPKAQGHQFVVKDDNTVILVSSSDRRVVDVIKKEAERLGALSGSPAWRRVACSARFLFAAIEAF